jgi:hypothetical protein
MSEERDGLWQVKSGAAALVVCLVRTMEETDPTFQDRFLENLEKAYSHFKHDYRATRSDGSPRDVIGVLEALGWTREMLTGWNNVTGQGEPLIKR